MLNIVSAMFDPIFLNDPNLKSTFAQKQSCRASLPLQLLFWPNFKLLYENLSFGWSNLGQNSLNVAVLFLCVTVLADAHTATDAGDSTRRPSAILARRADASLSARDAHHPFLFFPFSFLALAPSQAEQSSPSTSLWPNLAVPPRFLAPQAD